MSTGFKLLRDVSYERCKGCTDLLWTLGLELDGYMIVDLDDDLFVLMLCLLILDLLSAHGLLTGVVYPSETAVINLHS